MLTRKLSPVQFKINYLRLKNISKGSFRRTVKNASAWVVYLLMQKMPSDRKEHIYCILCSELHRSERALRSTTTTGTSCVGPGSRRTDCACLGWGTGPDIGFASIESCKRFVFNKIWANPVLFPFLISKSITISIQINKNVDGVHGIRTQGCRMVGADETTELWRPPLRNICSCFYVSWVRI